MHGLPYAVWARVFGELEELLVVSTIFCPCFLFIVFHFFVFFTLGLMNMRTEDKTDLNWKLPEPVELTGAVITLNFTLLLVSCRVILWKILSIFGSATSCHNGKELQEEYLSSGSEWETLLAKGKLIFFPKLFFPHYRTFT